MGCALTIVCVLDAMAGSLGHSVRFSLRELRQNEHADTLSRRSRVYS